MWKKLAARVAITGLNATIFGLEVLSDLTPGVRMTGRRRLPQNMSAGIMGAEVATWAAVSPSLLPRPWWVTAANVAIGQATGHLAATAAVFGIKRGLRSIGKRPQDRVGQRARRAAHLVLGAGTLVVGVRSLRNQEEQSKLVNKALDRGPETAALGVGLGTLGYGILLIAGEAVQAATTTLSHQAQRWVPRWVAWPLVGGVLGYTAVILSDRMLWRRIVRDVSAKAVQLNRRVYPGSAQPWEPERSGSPWSYEQWTAVGSQGRAFLNRGPRARDIQEVMRYDHAHEPIRIFIGLVPGRSPFQAAQQAVAEMERTGAFRRDTIVIQMPAGSGWLNNYSVSAYEFLTRGDCATVTVQFSYLASVFSYLVDGDACVTVARHLMEMIRARIEPMPADDRPKLYLSGESLGCYALVENFESLEDLLEACDGAVFTGPPRMTTFTQRLAARREPGSLERLPLVDAGRHVRFAATPAHLLRDAFGRPYASEWQRPRVLFGQHASDAIVWWDLKLAYRRPDWIHEPTPRTLFADTFRRLNWAPFITFWQVALDQVNSLNVPGGHGHNYFEETFWYWDAVLGSQTRTPLTPELADRMRDFVDNDQFTKPSDFRERVRRFYE
ncbi:alpha/beta-hydrolase family protein [uncultured Corynebacterium sp.]|uniref:alpha/beta-hydrolase family protein n=1 Tax=uncultured Corynebacterium sp. TaxID=159447 RepID=UPI0025F2135F|nr:alpha/beta-hydrolase family protein [uncultured Corynebacterium sp.]